MRRREGRVRIKEELEGKGGRERIEREHSTLFFFLFLHFYLSDSLVQIPTARAGKEGERVTKVLREIYDLSDR